MPDVTQSKAIPTVLTVRREASAGASGGYVDFGHDGALEYRAPAVDDGDGGFAATLVGLRPSTPVEYRVTEIGGTEGRESQILAAETGARPASVPGITADGSVPGPGAGFLITSFVPGPAVIVDGQGEVVWWHQLEVDYDHTITRALLSADGSGVTYLLWTNLHHGGPESWMRQLVRVSFDGQWVETLALSGAHHDLDLMPDGAIACLMYDAREVEGIVVSADRLVEVAPDGSLRQIWTVWDHVEFDPDQQYEGGERWGHCNAVDHDPIDDVIYVSCRNFSTIFRIDRVTGEVEWELGPDGDFELADGGTWFENEHQFQIDDGSASGRALVFDNAIPTEASSAVREYVFDVQAGTAEEIWSYQPDPPLGVYAFGDVSRLPGGDTLIAWGSSGRIERLDGDGRSVQRLDVALGAGVGYTTWVEGLYPVE